MPAAAAGSREGEEGEEGEGEEEAGPPSPTSPTSSTSTSAGRLCGYLRQGSWRKGGRRPPRSFSRPRWFVFEPRGCSLYAFKGPHEALPLARLDIAGAAFCCHPEGGTGTGTGTGPPSGGPPAATAATTAGPPSAHPGGQDRDGEAEPGTAFEIHSPGGAVTVLKAATQQDMTFWLQELQQKRWEYCNSRDAAKRIHQTSPTPSGFSKGLVAKDNAGVNLLPANPSAERARHVLAVETAPTEWVGEQAASQPAPGQSSAINFSLKQWRDEIKSWDFLIFNSFSCPKGSIFSGPLLASARDA